MKNKKYLLLLVVLIILFKINNASAVTLQRNFHDVWSFHYRNGKVWTYGQLNVKNIDGKLGYCIEPDSAINTNNYTSYEDWSLSGYSEEIKEKMKLYAYYGYKYPGHDDIKYYMATQELIWLFSDDEEIKWTTEDHSDSTQISIEKEKNEIQKLVDSHNILPSFSNNTFMWPLGSHKDIIDTNNVLNSYESNPSYPINSNKISVDFNGKNVTVLLTQKKLLYDKTLVYKSDIKSQRIATFGNPKLNSCKFYLATVRKKVTIYKKDKETNEIIKNKGNKIKITNLEDQEEKTYEFVDGKIETFLIPGNYSIAELSASEGYLKSDKCITFELRYDSNESLDYYNEPAKGRIKIKKVDLEDNILPGCIFNIYDKNKKVVDTIITTEKEYDESKLLPLGKYYIKEAAALNGYRADNNFYEVELKYKDDKTIVIEELDLINEKIKCLTTFIGTDEVGNRFNISYNIYDTNDNLIYSGNDESVELEYGDYYLVETKVPNGYILNKEKIKFSVSDDSCQTAINILNKKVNMPITSSKNMNLLYLIIFIINVCIYKKTRKIS